MSLNVSINGPYELESILRMRIHHSVSAIQARTQTDEQAGSLFVRQMLSGVIMNAVVEGHIPAVCVTKDRLLWCREMSEFADIRFPVDLHNTNADAPRQMELHLLEMCCEIWKPYAQLQANRVGTSPFIRSVRREVVGDDEFRLEMERAGLERLLRVSEPSASVKDDGRARMAQQVQLSIKKAEEQRLKLLEADKKQRAEEEKLEENGFGRVLELD